MQTIKNKQFRPWNGECFPEMWIVFIKLVQSFVKLIPKYSVNVQWVIGVICAN